MVVAGRDAQLCWFVGTCVLCSQRPGVVDARYAAFVPHVAHAAGGLARHGGLMSHSSASHASVCGLWLHVLLELLVVQWQHSVLLQLRHAVSLGSAGELATTQCLVTLQAMQCSREMWCNCTWHLQCQVVINFIIIIKLPN
jgi:hypothetical protein